RRAIPRAPIDLPILGNMPAYVRDPLAFLQRSAGVGEVVELNFPGLRSHLLTNPAHVEYVLVTANRNFVKDAFTREVRRILGDGLLTSDGDFWRRQRRLAQPAFHRERINAYATVMVDSTLRMLAGWRDGATRDVHEDLMHLTLDIVSRTLFGADVA